MSTGAETGGARPAGNSAAASAKPSKSPPQNRRKLSFKQKHALETLPDRIAGLEDEIARLNAEMADPELFRRDPDRFRAAGDRLAAAEAERDSAEESWLELEMLREEIEAERLDG